MQIKKMYGNKCIGIGEKRDTHLAVCRRPACRRSRASVSNDRRYRKRCSRWTTALAATSGEGTYLRQAGRLGLRVSRRVFHGNYDGKFARNDEQCDRRK